MFTCSLIFKKYTLPKFSLDNVKVERIVKFGGTKCLLASRVFYFFE